MIARRKRKKPKKSSLSYSLREYRNRTSLNHPNPTMKKVPKDPILAAWHRRKDLQLVFPDPFSPSIDKEFQNIYEWARIHGVKEDVAIRKHYQGSKK